MYIDIHIDCICICDDTSMSPTCISRDLPKLLVPSFDSVL